MRRRRTRSLSLVQPFAQALDFGAVETLIPDLQPRAEGFGCAQILDGVAERLSGCCEPAILRAVALRGVLPGTVQPERCSRMKTCLNSGRGIAEFGFLQPLPIRDY